MERSAVKSAALNDVALAGTRFPLAVPHADACSTDSSENEACYEETTRTYQREWRLWANYERDSQNWPAAMNEHEETVHASRFDGEIPLLLQTHDTLKPSYGDGEGGRRLADVHGNLQAGLGDESASDAGAVPVGSEGDESANLSAEGATLKPASASSTAEGGAVDTQAATADSSAKPGGTVVTPAAVGSDEAASAADVTSSGATSSSATSATTGTDAEPAFSIKAYNSYTSATGGLQNLEYAWSYIVEPYRSTTLEVDGAVDGASYEWTVDGHVQGHGASVEVLFMEIGYHVVKVEELVSTRASDDLAWSFDKGVWTLAAAEPAALVSSKVTTKVMAKYVRREVRSLTDADREQWLSAVMVMQRLPTVVGQELYGSKFYSKDHFTREHLYYGGALDCDHWHQGAGFVTSHVALTLQWEQALQSVNPSVAAPYWDFTLESTFYGASDWSSSFIFADDWFGDASPENELHTVVDGRWAFIPTLTDAKADYSYWVNSYGLMRAPWNNDPTPFLTRSGKVYGYSNNIKPSGCAEYSRAVKKTTWMSMSKQLNSAAHGHIHELMGGAWGHYYKTKLGGDTSPAVFTFAHEIQALSKILWRTKYVSCPESCDMTTPSSECQCTCDASSLQGMEAKDVLHDAGILGAAEYFDQGFHTLSKDDWLDAETGEPLDPIPGYDAAGTSHVYNSLLSLLCNPGHLGDMYQATSTNDITFWVIHNTVDRLWHFKRLGNLANYDETWDPFHTCYGHNPRNVQPFKDLFDAEGYVSQSAHRRRLGGSSDASSGASSDAQAPHVPLDPQNMDLGDTNSKAAGGATPEMAGSETDTDAEAPAASEDTAGDDASSSSPGAGDGKSGKAPGSLMTDKSAGAATAMASSQDKYYTNMELYELLHPNNRGLQYVYDNFEWPHCTKTGYEMINTW